MLSDEDKAIENAKWGLGIAAVIGLYHSLGIMFGSLYFPLFRWFIHGKKDLQKVDSSIFEAFVFMHQIVSREWRIFYLSSRISKL